MIIVDTDIMVDILRNFYPSIQWLESIANEKIVLPGFVVMELIQGCRDRIERDKIEKTISGYQITWPSPETCNQARKTFAKHHLTHKIGIIDVLIGQMAIDLGVPLYTFNEKHYSAIPGLRTVEPYNKAT